MPLPPIGWLLTAAWSAQPARPRMVKKSADTTSRGLLMVIAQKSAQSLATLHWPFALPSRHPRKQQDVAPSLVVPLGMEMVDILAQRPSQRPLAEQDHLGQALLLDRPNPALGVSIQVRALRRQHHRFNFA